MENAPIMRLFKKEMEMLKFKQRLTVADIVIVFGNGGCPCPLY